MPEVSFDSLAVVMGVAFVIPLLLGLAPRLRVPSVVLEIVAGIIVGPQVLGWAKVDEPVSILALVGLAFLLFLAGLELDLDQLRGRLLRVAGLGFVISLGLALVVGDRAGRDRPDPPAPARRGDPHGDVARARDPACSRRAATSRPPRPARRRRRVDR